ncbi:unnamed protein product [Sphagnum troendelagicum]|uniref:Ubiquitin-like protease family profile domain-containing protein n=1 Tax=Sphagnum troendelagicum TaxID=128251 RepID=A0ABP0UTU4_9BRYO
MEKQKTTVDNMDTARQHFLESETDRDTQTEELSNYSGEETPCIKRKQRQTQPRNSKQKQQCQLLVQRDRGRGCQHFASLQSKKRSRRSSQSRQATRHSELELAPDVDFIAGSDTHDGRQAQRTRSLSQDFLSKDGGWQAHRTRSLSQDFLKDGNASPKTVNKVNTQIPGRDSKITDLMEGDLPEQSACAPSSLYLDMTVLASKRRKFRHCGLPKEQAEYFQGEGLDCQQFDVCKHCQKISSNLHHISGEGGGVLLCSACRRKWSFLERLKSAVPAIHQDAKRPNASLDHNKGKRKFEAAVVGGTQATALELETSDDEEDTQIGGTGSTCNLSGSDQTKLLHSCNTIAKRMEGHKVAYPSRDDPEAVEIVHSDLLRLAPEEFLNDTVIDFYIKYIQRPEALTLEDKKRFHFFNSFFYKKLSEVIRGKKKKGGGDFLKLRKWTKGMNIFEKDYLFVPIHNSLHWSLAIICFPGADADLQSSSECCIIHLDSLITGGHKSQGVFNCLRSYLVAEWKYRRELHKDIGDFSVKTLPLKAESIRGRRVQVPLQDNESDCGLFLLHYIELFVKDAPSTFRLHDLDSRDLFGRSWFPSEDASGLRASILQHLESLFQKEASLSSHSKPVVLETVGEDEGLLQKQETSPSGDRESMAPETTQEDQRTMGLRPPLADRVHESPVVLEIVGEDESLFQKQEASPSGDRGSMAHESTQEDQMTIAMAFHSPLTDSVHKSQVVLETVGEDESLLQKQEASPSGDSESMAPETTQEDLRITAMGLHPPLAGRVHESPVVLEIVGEDESLFQKHEASSSSDRELMAPESTQEDPRTTAMGLCPPLADGVHESPVMLETVGESESLFQKQEASSSEDESLFQKQEASPSFDRESMAPETTQEDQMTIGMAFHSPLLNRVHESQVVLEIVEEGESLFQKQEASPSGDGELMAPETTQEDPRTTAIGLHPPLTYRVHESPVVIETVVEDESLFQKQEASPSSDTESMAPESTQEDPTTTDMGLHPPLTDRVHEFPVVIETVVEDESLFQKHQASSSFDRESMAPESTQEDPRTTAMGLHPPLTDRVHDSPVVLEAVGEGESLFQQQEASPSFDRESMAPETTQEDQRTTAMGLHSPLTDRVHESAVVLETVGEDESLFQKQEASPSGDWESMAPETTQEDRMTTGMDLHPSFTDRVHETLFQKQEAASGDSELLAPTTMGRDVITEVMDLHPCPTEGVNECLFQEQKAGSSADSKSIAPETVVGDQIIAAMELHPFRRHGVNEWLFQKQEAGLSGDSKSKAPETVVDDQSIETMDLHPGPADGANECLFHKLEADQLGATDSTAHEIYGVPSIAAVEFHPPSSQDLQPS